MKILVYHDFPACAKEIREKVFIEEQGFQSEFDEIDGRAVHLVAFDEAGTPVGTCRVFWNAAVGSHTLGRLAVLKAYRSRAIGSCLVKEAEKDVKSADGKDMALHSQCQAAAFYRSLGFMEYGDVEDEQGCPHIWMRKTLEP